jgi:hypothetical protein
MDNFRLAVAGERPLAWTPDSKRLLVVQGEGEYSLVNVPFDEERDIAQLPAGAHAATFISDQEVALAIPSPGVGQEIAAFDITTGAKRTLMTTPESVATLSFDPASEALAAVTVADGKGVLNIIRDGGVEMTRVDGLTSAAWYEAPASVQSATSTSASTSTTTVAPTTTVPPTTTTLPVVTTGTLAPAQGFPGITDWHALEPTVLGEVFLAPASSPQAKVDAMVFWFTAEAASIEGRRGVEGVVTAAHADQAQIEVRVLGFADDSVGGAEYRLQLSRQGDGDFPWSVMLIQQRELCSRGVAEGSNVCV